MLSRLKSEWADSTTRSLTNSSLFQPASHVTFIGIKWYELHYYYYVKHNPFGCDGVVHTDCSLFLREGKPRGRTLKCDFHFFL